MKKPNTNMSWEEKLMSLFQGSDYVSDRGNFWCVDGFINKESFKNLVSQSNLIDQIMEWCRSNKVPKVDYSGGIHDPAAAYLYGSDNGVNKTLCEIIDYLWELKEKNA